ncbi:MAG: dihydrodipicolinate synthase family protein [Halobacteriales archaeon]|nr:dihydrodipicolinate synthase family protein [Halobacteriales archaeon]
MTSELNGVVGIASKFLPCDADGAFDEESYRNLIDWQIKNGVGAVGTFQGHVYEYSDAFRREVAEIFVDEVDGRVPTVLGVASWDVETAIKRARDVEDLDIDVLYVVGPPLDRPYSDDPEDILTYLGEFNDAVDLPIMFCNSPAFWPKELEAETLLKLEDAAPRVEYIMNCSKRTHVHQEVAEGLQGSSIKVLGGKSYNTYHQLASTAHLDEKMVGLTGYLSGTLPGEHAAMYEAYRKDDLDEANRIWTEKILPVVNIFYGPGASAQANPPPDAVVEDIFTGFTYMLHQMGVIDQPRNPHSTRTVSDYTRREVDRYLARVEPSPKGREPVLSAA